MNLINKRSRGLQMRQLFQNITGNAITYKREGVPPVIIINFTIMKKDDNNFCKIKIINN